MIFKVKNYGFRKIRQELPNGGKMKKGTIKPPENKNLLCK